MEADPHTLGGTMARNDVETYRTATGRYANRLQGTYATQDEAAAVGRAVAERLRSEHFIRSLLGRWRARNTYPRSRDPRRSKG